MDYESRIVQIKQNIVLHFSQFGFGIQCDYAICNRIQGTFPHYAEVDPARISKIQCGGKIYINCHVPNIKECIQTLHEILPPLHVHFYVMGEPTIPQWIVDSLRPHAISMYLQNNTYEDPILHNLPIGIRDGEEVFPEHRHFTGRYILNEMRMFREKQYLCLLCFSYTHPERRHCEDILGNAEFVMNLNRNPYFNGQPSFHCGKVPVWITYEYTHKSHYTLSPTGIGQATHRFFEAIALHSTPIVKRTHTPLDKLYEEYPCLVVEEWSEVTREYLESHLGEMQDKMAFFHLTHPRFLTTPSLPCI